MANHDGSNMTYDLHIETDQSPNVKVKVITKITYPDPTLNSTIETDYIIPGSALISYFEFMRKEGARWQILAFLVRMNEGIVKERNENFKFTDLTEG